MNIETRALFVLAFLTISACGDAPDTKATAPEAATESAATPAPLVVYSSRAEQLIAPIFAGFTEDTGIDVEYVTDSPQPLIARLTAEGEQTPASVLLTVDAGNLWYAAEQDVLQPLQSSVLDEVVPAYLRDGASRWFGLSLRARTIVYDTRIVQPENLESYAALADPEWKGKLCLRTSKKVYNQSLVAMLIATVGEAETESIVSGWVDNLATDPFSNDTKLIEAIADGRCAVGIVNTYYLGRLQRENDLPVGLYFPAAEVGGTHVNISGAGIVKHAANKAAAQQLLEWLVSDRGQALFANENLEFPVRNDIENAPIVAAWGEYSPSEVPLENAGKLQAKAVQLMDRVGYR
ncbi:MAG: extracellular solute-binding protein [Woeseiaceae bacterium]